MKMQNKNTSGTAPEGMQFPCIIDVKVFLNSRDNNIELVRDVLLSSIDSEFLLGITTRESRQGKYEAFSCKINAQSQAQMDVLFTSLSAHPEVVMVI